jgi:hypothetical protein
MPLPKSTPQILNRVRPLKLFLSFLCHSVRCRRHASPTESGYVNVDVEGEQRFDYVTEPHLGPNENVEEQLENS